MLAKLGIYLCTERGRKGKSAVISTNWPIGNTDLGTELPEADEPVRVAGGPTAASRAVSAIQSGSHQAAGVVNRGEKIERGMGLSPGGPFKGICYNEALEPGGGVILFGRY